MGGEAEREARGADRLHVGIGEVLLAEMHVLGFRLDRRLPVIVDHELRRGAIGRGERLADQRQRIGGLQVLGAKLHGADAEPARRLSHATESTTG